MVVVNPNFRHLSLSFVFVVCVVFLLNIVLLGPCVGLMKQTLINVSWVRFGHKQSVGEIRCCFIWVRKNLEHNLSSLDDAVNLYHLWFYASLTLHQLSTPFFCWLNNDHQQLSLFDIASDDYCVSYGSSHMIKNPLYVSIVYHIKRKNDIWLDLVYMYDGQANWDLPLNLMLHFGKNWSHTIWR